MEVEDPKPETAVPVLRDSEEIDATETREHVIADSDPIPETEQNEIPDVSDGFSADIVHDRENLSGSKGEGGTEVAAGGMPGSGSGNGASCNSA